MIVIFEKYLLPQQRCRKLLVTGAMTVIIFSNILFANQLYFQIWLQFESMRDFYTTMIATVTQTEGFDESVKLAVVGDAPAMRRDFEQYFELSGFQHPSNSIIHTEHVEGFINNCVGYDLPYASTDEIAMLSENEQVQAMAVYPYYGSVKRIDDFIVVKFS